MNPILPREFYCVISSSGSSHSQPRIRLTGVLELIRNGYTTIRGALISQEILEHFNLITRDTRLGV
jgi:hypothetical protein